jgi:N-acetyl-anhydromuramyl-L-alanine amidase AmpD
VFLSLSGRTVQKVAALVKDIVTRYNIPPTNILAHSDIAPTRKQDPGPFSHGKDSMMNIKSECGMMKPQNRLYNQIFQTRTGNTIQ